MRRASRSVILKRIHAASVGVARGTETWSCIALDGEGLGVCRRKGGALADEYVGVFGYGGRPGAFQGVIADDAGEGGTYPGQGERKSLRLLLLAFYYEFVRCGDAQELANAP